MDTPLESLTIMDTPLESLPLMDTPLEDLTTMDTPLEDLTIMDTPLEGLTFVNMWSSNICIVHSQFGVHTQVWVTVHTHTFIQLTQLRNPYKTCSLIVCARTYLNILYRKWARARPTLGSHFIRLKQRSEVAHSCSCGRGGRGSRPA